MAYRTGLLSLCIWAISPVSIVAQFAASPDSAQIVFEDIERFWVAFDQPDRDAATLQELYLDSGSPGVQGFIPDRIESASALLETIEEHPEFYSSIRVPTFRVREFEDEIRAGLRALEAIYPASVFPPTYFVIGRINSGGHATEDGLIIGTELFAVSEDTPLDELDPGVRSVLESLRFSDLPLVVVHELVHFQQREPELAGRSLLGQVLYEGVADFIMEMTMGDLPAPNALGHAYGGEHEADVWRRFEPVMLDSDFSDWLYNQGRGTEEWPADMGYYVGFKIAEAYYEGADDRSQAIREMLTIENPTEFLEQSGYGAAFDN